MDEAALFSTKDEIVVLHLNASEKNMVQLKQDVKSQRWCS